MLVIITKLLAQCVCTHTHAISLTKSYIRKLWLLPVFRCWWAISSIIYDNKSLLYFFPLCFLALISQPWQRTFYVYLPVDPLKLDLLWNFFTWRALAFPVTLYFGNLAEESFTFLSTGADEFSTECSSNLRQRWFL